MARTPFPLRIAIVGSKGQLGQSCLSELLSAEHRVRAWDLPELDISARESVECCLSPYHPNIIINCAAYTDVDQCESDVAAARAVNVDGPRNLAEFSRKQDAWLFHVSTDYVFAGDRAVPQPYTEDDKTGPLSQYGITKRDGEQEVAAQTDRFTILRTSWLYSETGQNFPKAILKRALTCPDKALRVVNDQYGSPTWARTLARQIIALLDSLIPGILHATSEGYCSWYDFAVALINAMGLQTTVQPCTSSEYPRPASRPANSILENARLKQAGRNLMRNWEVDLAEFISINREKLLQEVA